MTHFLFEKNPPMMSMPYVHGGFETRVIISTDVARLPHRKTPDMSQSVRLSNQYNSMNSPLRVVWSRLLAHVRALARQDRQGVHVRR